MEQENNFVIDLETLGLKQDAAIISIGAVKFNIATGEILKLFHGNIKWDSALKYGKAEPETISWWQQQSGPAKEALTSPAQEDMEVIIDKFTSWLGIDPIVWGNGACFDIAKLERHYENVGHSHPWSYKNTRDVRTMSYLGRNILGFSFSDFEFTGIPHHPVDDSINTAKYISQIYDRLVLKK